MKAFDICPKCNTEGDPIEAINCKPCKWCCASCGEKWAVSIEEQEKTSKTRLEVLYEKYPNL